MEQVHLKLIPGRKDTFHPKVGRAIDNISRCIIDLVVKYKGQVSLAKVEKHTGLKSISNEMTVSILRYMAKQGVIEIRGMSIVGNVKELTNIIDYQKNYLPKKHDKFWSEDEYTTLAEMKIDKCSNAVIAMRMQRTEHSIGQQISQLKKAYDLIPVINNNKAIRDFIEASRGKR